MKSIRPYNTFRVDHKLADIYTISSIDELRGLCQQYPEAIVIGGGSNLLFTKDLLDKPAFMVDLMGIKIIKKEKRWTEIRVGAGESWHDVVSWSIGHHLGGLENLSLIPGKCGAAPIQNIGAYGVELADVLVSVECMDRHTGTLIDKSKKDCALKYRDSIFKRSCKDQYIITSITLRLSNDGYHQITTAYGDINHVLKTNGITQPTIKDVSEAVIKIRRSKLPDPDQIPNAGSFFKNPIIPIEKYRLLKSIDETIPSYPISDTHCKVPAGYLIDRCGWKGVMIDQVGVHGKQALVLVNHGASSGQYLLQLSKLIQAKVANVYKIKLETEVTIY